MYLEGCSRIGRCPAPVAARRASGHQGRRIVVTSLRLWEGVKEIHGNVPLEGEGRVKGHLSALVRVIELRRWAGMRFIKVTASRTAAASRSTTVPSAAPEQRIYLSATIGTRGPAPKLPLPGPGPRI